MIERAIILPTQLSYISLSYFHLLALEVLGAKTCSIVRSSFREKARLWRSRRSCHDCANALWPSASICRENKPVSKKKVFQYLDICHLITYTLGVFSSFKQINSCKNVIGIWQQTCPRKWLSCGTLQAMTGGRFRWPSKYFVPICSNLKINHSKKYISRFTSPLIEA